MRGPWRPSPAQAGGRAASAHLRQGGRSAWHSRGSSASAGDGPWRGHRSPPPHTAPASAVASPSGTRQVRLRGAGRGGRGRGRGRHPPCCGHPPSQSPGAPWRLHPRGSERLPCGSAALQGVFQRSWWRGAPPAQWLPPHLIWGPSTRGRIGCCSASRPPGTAGPQHRRCHTAPWRSVPPRPRGRCPVSLGGRRRWGWGWGGDSGCPPSRPAAPGAGWGDPCPLLPCPAGRGGRVAYTLGRGPAGVVAAAQAALLLAGALGVIPAPGSAVVTGNSPAWAGQEPAFPTAWGGCGAPGMAAQTHTAARPPPRGTQPPRPRGPLAPGTSARLCPMAMLRCLLPWDPRGWHQTPLPRGTGAAERSCPCPHGSAAPHVPPWCSALHNPAHRPPQHRSPLPQSPSVQHLIPSCQVGVAMGATAHGCTQGWGCQQGPGHIHPLHRSPAPTQPRSMPSRPGLLRDSSEEAAWHRLAPAPVMALGAAPVPPAGPQERAAPVPRAAAGLGQRLPCSC